MLAKWGIPAAALAACALFGLGTGVAGAAEQPTWPSIPPPPSGGPTLEIPTGMPTVPEMTGLNPTKPSEPPAGSDKPGPRPLLPESVNIALKLEKDGSLSVTEQVFVQAGKAMTRRAPLRIRTGDQSRVFTVRDVEVKGNAKTRVTPDEFVMELGEGATTVAYHVDGVVDDVGDHQEMRWQVASGWDTKLRLLRASFVAPDQPQEIVCLAGAFGSTDPCGSALTDSGQILRVVQEGLVPGNRVDLQISLPKGTVDANARYSDLAATNAFALTTASGLGLGALVLLLLGGFVLLWLARGRDAKALATDVGPVDLLMTGDGGRVAFASPDGVLPGEVGTVVDERVDVADITATVVDLAVRNYVSIREASAGDDGADWRITRRNPADAALTDYERVVYDEVLGQAEEVPVAGLRVDPERIRAAMYTNVVARNWFTRRPDHDRSLWSLVGVLLAVVGAAATVVLALTVGHALLGLALLVGGIGLALGARMMPARTKRGSVLVQQVRGLLNYLRTTETTAIPPADREMVLSRSLPYAVVLGEVTGWVRHFTDLDAAADGTPGIYWYESAEPGQFPQRFPGFLAAMDVALGGDRAAPAPAG